MSRETSLKNRRSTSAKVRFPTVPSLIAQPISMYLKQAQGHHDVLTLEFPTTSLKWFENLTTGVPIKLTWAQGRLKKDWYGYINHVSKEVQAQRQNIMQVVCVSSSFVFKERDTRVFTNTTVTDVIRLIAKEFEFNLVIDDHPRIFEQLTMSGHSYWEWIQEQAKKIGYVAYIDEMTLNFRPVDKVIDATVNSSPILRMLSTAAPYAAHLIDSTLDYIKVIKGENIENSSALRSNKKIAGVNPYTGEIVQSEASPKDVGVNLRSHSSTPLFNEFRYDNVVDSSKNAEYSAKASAELGRFNIPADIKGQGDCRLFPYASFYVQNTGADTDGFWIVQSITHVFGRNGQYSMSMRAVTDGVKKAPQSSNRPQLAAVVGVIDVQELIEGAKLLLRSDSVVLKGTKDIVNESSQNFITTETRWVVSGI